MLAQSIGPFCGANAHATHAGDAVACLRAELVAYAARFGVAAQAVGCAPVDAAALAEAFPELRLEPRAYIAGGVLYLTRLAAEEVPL